MADASDSYVAQFPLAAEQRRFLFLHHANPASAEIYITHVVHVRGLPDVAALRAALTFVVHRHDLLRATFAVVDGETVHRIRPPGPVDLRVLDLGDRSEGQRDLDLAQVIAAEAKVREPFDIFRGPLFAFTLIRLGPLRHELIVRFHHIICDFLSSSLFFHEFVSAYRELTNRRTPRLPHPAPSFRDFVSLETARAAQATATSSAYWQRQLAGACTKLELPTDTPRPPRHTYRAKSATLLFGQGRPTVPCSSRSRREATTPFMSLFAAFAGLLFRFSGQPDILIGSPIATSRDDPTSKQMFWSSPSTGSSYGCK